MLKRDYLMAQIQLLFQVLAKVKRLIMEGQQVPALAEVHETLSKYYGITEEYLVHTPIHVFILEIKKHGYEAEELHMMTAFIDELAGLVADEGQRKAIWHKVIALFELMENDYRTFSFEQASRKQVLQQALE